MIEITPERPADAGSIEALLDQAFGPDRLKKSSYRYRRRVARLWPLCLVARDDDRVIGTIRYWPIMIGPAAAPALLLGPVAVDAAYRSEGLGARLVGRSLAAACAGGHSLVLLVGDKPYYGRFGFKPAAEWGISMLAENPARVLALRLDDTMDAPAGLVQRWRAPRRETAARRAA